MITKTLSRNNAGFSLVELMVSLVIAAVMLGAILSIFMNQNQSIRSETQRDVAASEAQAAFDTLSRLLRQAKTKSIVITGNPKLNLNNDNSTPQISNDGIDITFEIPAGYAIWPNDKGAFTANEVRVVWSNSPGATNPYSIGIANAAPGGSNAQALTIIAGTNAATGTRIINLDFWPLDASGKPLVSPNSVAQGGYLIQVSTRSGQIDVSYTNPSDPTGDLKNYRTYTAAGIVTPRN